MFTFDRRRGVAAMLLSVAVLGSACTATDVAPPLPADHPARPDAAEAAPPPQSTTLQLDGSPPSAPVAPVHGPFHCPMHHEVVSDVPGVCPKCGMQLVPIDAPDAGGR